MTREDAETVAESSAFVGRWAEDKVVLRRNLVEVQGVAAGLIEKSTQKRLLHTQKPVEALRF